LSGEFGRIFECLARSVRVELLTNRQLRVEQVGVCRILNCGRERAREKVVPRLGQL
jgi:hypothetical protein